MTDLSGLWIDRVHDRKKPKIIILDMDSSESPTHGDQEGSAYNGHPGELYPRIGFIVTNLSRPTERVVAFYNHRGTAEQWIKEGKNAIKWTRLFWHSFRNNMIRLQLHALA